MIYSLCIILCLNKYKKPSTREGVLYIPLLHKDINYKEILLNDF
jgi:hypothetical protein